MNLTKNKKYLIPLFLIALFAVGVAITPASLVKADLSTAQCPVSSIYITLEGWEYVPVPTMVAKKLSIRIPLSLDHVNDTDENVVIPLTKANFDEDSEKPSNYQTDGITMTYSDGLVITSSGLRSEAGIYDTLGGISEADFLQSDYSRESSIYTFSTDEPFSTTITEYMETIDSSFTYLNFSITAMYATLYFDRTPTDAFYTDASLRPSYTEVAENYDQTSSPAFVTALLNPVFDDHISGIIYSPFNTTDYAADWTPAKEVRAVLGGNATDTSINGTVSITDIRNGLYGFIGAHKSNVVDVVPLALPDPIAPSGDIWGFKQSESYYEVNYNILTDFASSPVIANYTTLFGLFVPTEAQVAAGTAVYWCDSAIIAAISALSWMLLATIVLHTTKFGKKMNTKTRWAWILISSAVIFFMVFIIVLLATIQYFTPTA